MSNFNWPWQYDFPPFFTMQKNADTKSKQMEAWCTLVLEYHQHNKLTKLRLADASTSPLFYNKAIDRKLTLEHIKEILDCLHKKGNVEWTDKAKTQCKVFWKTTEQWADLIYNWASKTGVLNTVCTVHELSHGPNSTDEPFHGLEDWLLLQSLNALQTRGKAELIGDEGVKFFA